MRAVIAWIFVVALGVATAHAHAQLDRSEPTADSTITPAPRQVTLSFTQNLEPAFSTVAVTDSKGARVDDGKPEVSGSTMRIALKALGPGSYRVHWHAVSVDSHTTEGDFAFTVGSS